MGHKSQDISTHSIQVLVYVPKTHNLIVDLREWIVIVFRGFTRKYVRAKNGPMCPGQPRWGGNSLFGVCYKSLCHFEPGSTCAVVYQTATINYSLARYIYNLWHQRRPIYCDCPWKIILKVLRKPWVYQMCSCMINFNQIIMMSNRFIKWI